jgi:hypothetical protein
MALLDYKSYILYEAVKESLLFFENLNEGETIYDQKIKDPSSGRRIKISTALKKEKNSNVYQVARKIVDQLKKDGKELGSEESNVTPKIEGRLGKTLDRNRTKIQSSYSQIKYASNEDKEKFEESFDKILSGKSLDGEEANLVAKYAKISDSENALKIYFATTGPSIFAQNKRKNALEAGDKGGELKKQLQSLGMEITPAVTAGSDSKPLIGPKDVNPAKLAGGTYKAKVAVKKSEKGEIEEVEVEGTKLKRLTAPNEEELGKAIKEQNPGYSEAEVSNMVERTNRAIERHNENLERFAKLKDVEFLEPVPGLRGLSQKERADKITKEYPKKIAEKFREKFGDNPTDYEKEVLSKIEGLSDIKDPEDFSKASIELLNKIEESDSIRKGAADLSESIAYMYMNKKGIRTELPAAENFPVADIICMGGDYDLSKLNPKDPDYAKKVAMQGMPFVVSLEQSGGVSVKKDGGAGSALEQKLEATTFKNKETVGKLKDLAKNHNNFMGTLKEPTTKESIEAGKKKLDEVEKWATQNGIFQKDELPLNYGKRTPAEWAKDTLKKWEYEGNGPFRENIKEALEQHCRAAILIEAIHNKELKEQSYGNINIVTSKSDPGIHITDGINTASLMKASPNNGIKLVKDKDGYSIPRPVNIYGGKLDHGEYDVKTQSFVSAKNKA